MIGEFNLLVFACPRLQCMFGTMTSDDSQKNTKDDEFWRFQAHSLAIFATPEKVKTYRVPNALSPMAEVSDRFHLKPLLRAVTFPQVAYALALAEGNVRLIEVLVALAVVAIALVALLAAAARMSRDADRLRELTLADWVAANVLVETRLRELRGQLARVQQIRR